MLKLILVLQVWNVSNGYAETLLAGRKAGTRFVPAAETQPGVTTKNVPTSVKQQAMSPSQGAFPQGVGNKMATLDPRYAKRVNLPTVVQPKKSNANSQKGDKGKPPPNMPDLGSMMKGASGDSKSDKGSSGESPASSSSQQGSANRSDSSSDAGSDPSFIMKCSSDKFNFVTELVAKKDAKLLQPKAALKMEKLSDPKSWEKDKYQANAQESSISLESKDKDMNIGKKPRVSIELFSDKELKNKAKFLEDLKAKAKEGGSLKYSAKVTSEEPDFKGKEEEVVTCDIQVKPQEKPGEKVERRVPTQVAAKAPEKSAAPVARAPAEVVQSTR